MSREALELIEEAERRAAGIEAARAATRWCPHKPTPKQAEFLDLDGLEAMYGGAAGGGKSDALLMAALQYADVPGYAALILRRTLEDLRLPGGLMDRAREWLAPTAARSVDDGQRWIFPSGAQLVFGYCKNDADRFRYKSSEFQFVAWEELTEWPTDVPYTYLFSRLRRLKGSSVPLRVRSATNPGGRGHRWVAKRFAISKEGSQDREKATDPYTKQVRLFVPSRLADNPHIDAASYRTGLAQLDSTTREQLEGGKWVEDGKGLIYPYSSVNLIEAAPRSLKDWAALGYTLPKLPRWHYVLGIDLGASELKPTTAYTILGWAQYVPSKVFVLESHKEIAEDVTATAEECERLEEIYDGFSRIVMDEGGLGKGYGKEFRRRHKIPVVPADKRSKLGFRRLLRGSLERADVLIVEEANPELLQEMQDLRWDERGLDNEPGADNHCSDALLYGWRETTAFAAALPDTKPAPGTPEAAEHEERQREDEEDRAGRERRDQPWFRKGKR